MNALNTHNLWDDEAWTKAVLSVQWHQSRDMRSWNLNTCNWGLELAGDLFWTLSTFVSIMKIKMEAPSYNGNFHDLLFLVLCFIQWIVCKQACECVWQQVTTNSQVRTTTCAIDGSLHILKFLQLQTAAEQRPKKWSHKVPFNVHHPHESKDGTFLPEQQKQLSQ